MGKAAEHFDGAWALELGLRVIVVYPVSFMAGASPFLRYIAKGYDIRPTIAVTKAHIDLPECKEAIREGRLKPDGDIMTEDGQSHISKVACEPVWYLPGIAERFEVTEQNLRQALFRETNMM